MDIKKPKFWILGIAMIGAALYLQTINYGYSADDGIYSYFNRVTQEGVGEWTELFKYGSMNFIQINPSNTSIYRPFTLLTFAFEYAIVGDFNAGVGHGINVFLYFLVVCIIGFLFLELFPKRNLPIWLLLLILILYAVHPIHTEVVASVKSRDTLLSSLFGFLAIFLWVKSDGNLSVWKWIGVLFIYFLSLISKEESIPLLALVGLIAWFFQKKSIGESLKSILPFLIPVSIYLVLRSIVLDPVNSSLNSTINSVLYGAEGSDHLATNLFIYLQYLKLLVFPHPLSWDYSFSQLIIQSFSNPWVWVSLILFIGLAYIAYDGFKKRSLFSFGILLYFATFSIFANLTRSLIIGSNLGERFLFIPSLAFCFLIGLGLFELINRKWSAKSGQISFLILLPVFLLFSWKTYSRSEVWESNLTLSASGVETAPKSWRTHVMYADALRIQGIGKKKENVDSAQVYFKKAIVHFNKGFEILGEKNPVPQYLSGFAEVLLESGDSTKAEVIMNQSMAQAPKYFYPWFKMAFLEFQRGDYEKARDLYLNALKSERPDLYATYKNLGQSYYQLGDYTNAISSFEKSKEQKEDSEVDKLLGYLYTKEGMIEKAKALNLGDSTLSFEETDFLVTLNRGNDAFSKKKYAEAISLFREVEDEFQDQATIDRFPNYYAAFGKALIETSDTLEAKRRFLKAYEIDSKNPVVLTNLGIIALLKDKRYPDAERYFKAAVESNPEDPYSARVNLGTSLILQRKEKEAIKVLEDALNYGSSRPVLGNLFLLNKAIGDTERMNYYQNLLDQ
jgi:tetratricopeptide (TPR) repeat protein